MALAPYTKLGQYEIAEAIGAGGMGEVYRARDTKLDRDVAIKVLPDALSQDKERLVRFEREAKLLASLNHPGIAHLYGFEEFKKQHYIVMELVDGVTLAEQIAPGPVGVEEALPLLMQIAEGLEAAHEKGIIHRDLKPANIKVTPEGKVKILDFGLAKVFTTNEDVSAETSQSPTLTKGTALGVIMGTAAYMSPEQARGKPVDKRTDIWAFGVVLYEVLTGRRAFLGEDVSLTLAEVMKSDPDWSKLPTATPRPIRQLLHRCVDKEPRRRLRDIGEARILLEDPFSGSPAEETSMQGQVKRNPGKWIAASAAFLVALAFVLYFARPFPSSERVFRYSVPLPEGLTIGYAFSPDGRHAAFMSATGEIPQIYVRALDSWDLQALPNTLDVTGLFWSPDSRYIAFFAREKLWKVAVNGGPAEVLCDVPGLFGAGGTWGRNGVIIFAPSDKYEPGPLRSVPASGGESTPLTTAATGESHRFPVFLPDGEHFLYTRLGGPNPGIYIASLDEPEGRRLVADESSAQLASAPDARGATHLLFIRDGDLIAQELDTDRLELSGEPTILLEDAAWQDDGAAAVSVSEDGILSYLGGRDREKDSRFSWFDRHGNVITDQSEIGTVSPASLSPDGKTMVVPLPTTGPWTVDLYLRDVTRGVEERFTFDHAADKATNAVWSPDGSKVVFSANSLGSVDLFWKDILSSGPPELLLKTDNPNYVTDWSRDGRYVLFTELDPKTQADIWYLTMENGGTTNGMQAAAPVPFLRTEFLESTAQLSPDSKWISYLSNETGEMELYVRAFPSGEGKRKISSGYTMQPRWGPHGKELFYFVGSVSNPTLMSVTVTTADRGSSGGFPIFETGESKPLFQVRANNFHPAQGTFFYSVSADGQRFLINHVDNVEDPVLNVVVNWPKAFGINQER